MAKKGIRVKGMIPARIKECLNYELRWMTVREIAEHISEDPDVVHGAIYRLWKSNEIDRRIHWIGNQRYGPPYIYQFRSLEVEG